MTTQTLKVRFDNLDQRRKVLLHRAQEYAELSIPSLYPRSGLSETSELPVPFSASTARGVSRLASRLVSAIYPLNNVPFFALELDEAEPVQGEDPTEEQKVLSRMERRIMRKLSTTNLRSTLFAAFQHLQVVGNCVLYINDNYNLSLYRIDNFVIRLRPDGEWHELLIREAIDQSMLPEMLKEEGHAEVDSDSKADAIPEYLYTKVINNHKGGCSVEREFKGRKLVKPENTGDYKVCPYLPLGWTHVAGENYYRGLIEDNLGDIRALEVMAESLLDAMAANSEYRFGVNPAGITEIHDLQSSVNGAFVPAADGDVFPIQLGNQAQVEAAQRSVTMKEQTLGQTFLLNSAVQPQGDRVTATLVRLLANELEQALGGVFSDVSRALQIPLVRRFMYMMLKDGLLIPEDDEASAAMQKSLEDPDGILAVKVKSGLEALSREVENEKMVQIMEIVKNLPEAGQQAVIWPGLLNRFVSTFGVEPKGIIYTVDEMAQQAQAQQAAAMQQAGAEQTMATQGTIAEQAAATAMAA